MLAMLRSRHLADLDCARSNINKRPKILYSFTLLLIDNDKALAKYISDFTSNMRQYFQNRD